MKKNENQGEPPGSHKITKKIYGETKSYKEAAEWFREKTLSSCATG